MKNRQIEMDKRKWTNKMDKRTRTKNIDNKCQIKKVRKTKMDKRKTTIEDG